MRRLDTGDADFQARLAELTAWDEELDSAVNATVTSILADVAQRGDEALLEYTRRFDALDVASARELEMPAERLAAALAAVDADEREALEQAAARIRSYLHH